MPNIADIGFYFIGAMFVLVFLAFFNSWKESDDEKLRKFIKKRLEEIFKSRMGVVVKPIARKVIWKDHEGRLTFLGASNHYGLIGSGEYMIFFKKAGKFLMIFPNIFEDHLCIRSTVKDVKRLGEDSLVVTCIGFQPINNYWYAVTEDLDADVIDTLMQKDRDLLMSDILQQEMVGIAKTKLDASLIAGLSHEDLGDLQSNLMDMGENKSKKGDITL